METLTDWLAYLVDLALLAWILLAVAGAYIAYERARIALAERRLKASQKTVRDQASSLRTTTSRLEAKKRELAARTEELAETRRSMADLHKSRAVPDSWYVAVKPGNNEQYRWTLRDGTDEQFRTLARTANVRGHDSRDDAVAAARELFGPDIPIRDLPVG